MLNLSVVRANGANIDKSRNITFSGVSDKPEKRKKNTIAAKATMTGLSATAAITAGILAIKKGLAAKALKEINTKNLEKAKNTIVNVNTEAYIASVLPSIKDCTAGERRVINDVTEYLQHNVFPSRAEIAKKIKESVLLAGEDFRPVNKTVKFADGEVVNIIYEGNTLDVTADGKLLRKILITIDNGSQKITYENIVLLLQEQIIKTLKGTEERIEIIKKATSHGHLPLQRKILQQ